MKSIKYATNFSFASAKKATPGIKGYFAWLLRSAASKLDGQRPILLQCDSSPELNNSEMAEVISFGMKNMKYGFEETVKNKSVEPALDEHFRWEIENDRY